MKGVCRQMRRNTRVYSILKWVFIALTLLEALLLCVTADMTHGAAAVLFALCAFAFGVQGRRRPSTGEEPDEPPKKGKKSKNAAPKKRKKKQKKKR